MPTIPRLEPTVRPAPSDIPGQSVAVAEQPGEAAARLGDAAAAIGNDITQRQVDLRRSRQVIAATSGAALDANQFINNQIQDPDYATFPQRVQAGLKSIQDQYGNAINDQQAKLTFNERFTSLTDSSIINARAEVRKRENAQDLGVLSDSLDKFQTLAVAQSGPALDSLLATAKGSIDSRVAGGILTGEEGKAMWKSFSEGVSNAKALQDIRQDPKSAYANLENGNYPDLDPVRRQYFMDEAKTQAIAQDKQAQADLLHQQEIAQKIAKDERDAAVSQMTSQALAGTLTHPDLESARTRYNLSREDFEHLYDLINKPPQQPPSDPATLSAMTLAVRSADPKVTKGDLADIYRSGKLNLDDYTKLDGELTSVLHYNAEQGKEAAHYQMSQAEEMISQALKADPATEAQARADLIQGSVATGGISNPITLVPGILKKYQPAIDALGGVSKATAESQFNSARTSYAGSIVAQQKWNGDHFIKDNVGFTNPYDAEVEQRRTDLLNKARISGRDAGPAKSPEGTVKDLNGKRYVVLGGHYIQQ